jgi:hypothetical protein
MRWLVILALWLAACQSNNFDPASYVNGPRLLTVIAEPPELKAGESTKLHALVVGADTIHWSACMAPRTASSGLIQDACVTDPSVLVPIGDGPDAQFTMPALDIKTLGLPDASGGLYLPLRIDFGQDRGFYRLRYSLGLQPPNQNPVIDGVDGVAIQDTGADLSKLPSPQPFTEATPIEVGEREGVRLRAAIADGSAETYAVPESATSIKMLTEELRVIWYASSGTFNNEVTGLLKPDTIFRLDKFEPQPGSLIDLWVVVADERGGQAFTHRSLLRR